MAALIRATCPDECIVSIDKVKNPVLEAEFEKTKAEIAAKRGWPSCPEKIVFHGKTEAGMWSIVSQGFRVEMNRVSAFGIGTYCSPSAIIARSYARETHMGDNAMLVCKMAWGKPMAGCHGDIPTDKADMSVNNIKNPTIISVPYTYGIIPLYAVQFYARARK